MEKSCYSKIYSRYNNKWVVCSNDRKRILAIERTEKKALDKALKKGEKKPIWRKFPPSPKLDGSKMRFRYKREKLTELDVAAKVLFKNKYMWHPEIMIILKYKKNSKFVEAYIDNCSSYCVFPREYAEALGIKNIESGIKSYVKLPDGTKLEHYFHKVSIIIFKYEIKVYAGFTKDYNSPPLLGQLGFFQHFKVKFDYRKKTIEIEPYKCDYKK